MWILVINPVHIYHQMFKYSLQEGIEQNYSLAGEFLNIVL